MNQSQFEHRYREQWEQFRRLLEALESKSINMKEAELGSSEFPSQYRQLCNQFGLAQCRHYSPALVDRLHNLVLRGHHQLYKRKKGLLWASINFIFRDFPRTLRANWLAFWLAFTLFYGPAVALGIATYQNPVLIYSLMDENKVYQMESMYNPDNKAVGRSADRNAETDFTMFGFYILNNISIGFRTFAGGIIFGIGTVFLLVYNGLSIGGVAGHLSHPPYMETFWPFVSGHGAFELTAIVICGAAGLLLGYSIIHPGQYRRTDSLRIHAPTSLRLVVGAALLLVCAAFIEAFWSSSTVSPTVKYAIATCNWILVILYLLFAGRDRHES